MKIKLFGNINNNMIAVKSHLLLLKIYLILFEFELLITAINIID